jgi:hypothetical protein
MLTNKYSKLYYKITSNAKQRITEGYTELHHIIPQSMGGSNDKENLVNLTAREHFICHWLLVKMTEGTDRSKMLYALNGMKAENKYQERYHTKITARVYEKYRIEHSENHSKTMKGRPAWNKGRKLEGEELEKHLERTKNRKQMSPETKAKWITDRIATVTGTKRSEETKKNISLSLKGKSKGPQSDEHKLAISLAGKGIKKKDGHGVNVANAVLGNISINKDNVEKKVKQDTLQSYLDSGWQLGGKKRKVA